MPGRTVAIGDIHGCSLALDALLDAIEPSPEDTIVTLGDYVDRGPDTKGVIDRLRELSGRTRLVPIIGNHEEMLLVAREAVLAGRHDTRVRFWLAHGGQDTVHSYGPEADGPRAIPPEHIAFLRSCIDGYETEAHLYVHASYDPAQPLDKQSTEILRWESLKDSIPGPHISGKVAIVGHTAQRSGEVLDLGYLKCIDTCCYGGGWLTALDVDSGRLWQADASGRLRA